jgi:2-haloacid dehalogenase
MPVQRAKIVVFDIGKVLIDWDPRHLYRTMFSEEAEMEAFLREVCARDWILELDRGKPFAEAVIERIALFPHYEKEIRAFDERWHETNRGVIEGSMAVLKKLRVDGVPNYAITNFSAEKFEGARTAFPFLDSFDGIVVSGRERLLKPDAAIYRLLLDRHNLKAGDCIFIDDSAANVAGAKAVGMHGHHFIGAERLARDLRAHGFDV